MILSISRRTDIPAPCSTGWRDMRKSIRIGYDSPLTPETHCLYPDPMMPEGFAKFNDKCPEYPESLMTKENDP